MTVSKNAFSYWVSYVLTGDSGFYRGIRGREEKARKNIRGKRMGEKGQ